MKNKAHSKADDITALEAFVKSLPESEGETSCGLTYFANIRDNLGAITQNIRNDFPWYLGVLAETATVDKVRVDLEYETEKVAELTERVAELNKYDVRAIRAELVARRTEQDGARRALEENGNEIARLASMLEEEAWSGEEPSGIGPGA